MYTALLILALLTPAGAAVQQVDSLEARLGQARGADRLVVLSELIDAYQRHDPARAVAYGREALAAMNAATPPAQASTVWYRKGVAHLRLGQFDAAAVHGEQALALAKQARDEYRIARAYYLQGMVHGSTGASQEALRRHRAMLRIMEHLDDPEGIADALNALGIAYSKLGDPEQALAYYREALATREAAGDRRGVADALNNIAIEHWTVGAYDQALAHYFRALEIREALGEAEAIATTVNNIGVLYKDMERLDQALAMYQRALALWESTGNERGVAMALNNIGVIHTNRGDLPQALAIYERVLAVCQRLGDREGVAAAYTNLGQVYTRQGHHEHALAYHQAAYDLHEAMESPVAAANALNNIADVQRRQGRAAEALRTIEEALALIRPTGNLDVLQEAYATQTEIYEALGHYAEALAAHRRYQAVRDSLFNRDRQAVIEELEARYQTRQQEQQIEELQQERAMQQIWHRVLALGLVLLAAIAFLLFNRYRLKHRSHQALEAAHADLQQAHQDLGRTQRQLAHAQKMASLGKLAAGIAHEIKNPLNFVTNFAALNRDLLADLPHAADAAEADELAHDLEHNTAQILKHSRRIDDIVRSMMAHARYQGEARYPVGLPALLDECIGWAREAEPVQQVGLDVHIETVYAPDVEEVVVAPQEIGRVMQNLLGNALHAVADRARQAGPEYTPQITVHTRHCGTGVEIGVADNGSGIAEAEQDRIFEPFFTTKPAGQGHTGLGLSLAYEIITQGYGGTLQVTSRPGEGAAFTFTLPETIPTELEAAPRGPAAEAVLMAAV